MKNFEVLKPETNGNVTRYWFRVYENDEDVNLYAVVETDGEFDCLVDAEGYPRSENEHWRYGVIFNRLCGYLNAKREKA